jgi:hypothetical protein
MPTLGCAIERLYERHMFNPGAPVSLGALINAIPSDRRGSVRSLQASILGMQAERKPWAVILCRFQGEAPVPTTEAFYRAIFTPGSGGLVEYWRDVSHGAIDISGSVVFDWVEVDILRANAGNNHGKGENRATLNTRAIDAVRRRGQDPVTGFHSQIAVYTEKWAKDGAPADADYSDPEWGQYWIDGSATDDPVPRVTLTPPHNGSVTAHEMGHGFGMAHDLGIPDMREYGDACCIMSQNNPWLDPHWDDLPFGPSVCVPHLRQLGWMYKGRLYEDDGGWLKNGIEVPLAPLAHPRAHANLGIRLPFRDGDRAWDYFLEYVQPEGWNSGLLYPFVAVRRSYQHPKFGLRPAFIGALEIPEASGRRVTWDDATGNVRFGVERFTVDARILKVSASRL